MPCEGGSTTAVTISFGLKEGVALDVASEDVRRAIMDLRMPDIVQAEFAGDAKAFAATAGAQPLLILAALVGIQGHWWGNGSRSGDRRDLYIL